LLNQSIACEADEPGQPDEHSASEPAPLQAEPEAPEPEAAATEAPAAEAPAPDAAPEPAVVQPETEAEPVAILAAEEPAEPLPIFADLGLSDPILRAIEEKGYRHPTPIQAQAIPAVLSGRDVMGVAQTGTGKTASFTLPMLDILDGSRARARMPRSLILEPTRELALQVAENFVEYGKYLKLNHALLIGGESLNDQKDALMKGVDVLIATPGRLLDLFERGGLMLTDTKLLVIDEADRMLDMGFIPDVERIVGLLPKNRQTLFFSATMAPEIRRLSDAFLSNPRVITVSKSASVATTIVAGLALVADQDKREALRRLIRSEDVQNALIFCNRKVDVDILYKSLSRHGFSVGSLHGDMSQPARFATLDKFKKNELRLLVCSDVAARGIDIGGLSHVFNFDVPIHAEDYVHRIGRTGRAGLVGHAFTLASPDDKFAVDAIEKLVGAPIPPIVVPGLDVVEWAEGDGRKRRGRGGKSGGRDSKSGGRDRKPERSEAKPERAAEPEQPPADEPVAAAPKPRRGRGRGKGGDRAAAAAPAVARAPEVTAPEAPDTRPARPAPRQAPAVAPERFEPRRDAPAAARPEYRSEPRFDRAPNRDYRRRDEDLGPSVLGFGDEVPAFMTLPRRASLAPELEES
jgi:superfamily II DNA/RNA helicase